MKKILVLLICLKTLTAIGQVPFSTYRKPSKATEGTEEVTENSDSTKLSRATFFDHANANLISIQNGKKFFPTINGEVMNYRLAIFTTGTGDERRPHFLPISLITKVSGDYADSSAGPTNDATSYFGAPLTFRFAPAFEPFLNKDNDNPDNRFFIGLNTDLRLLTIGDAVTNKINVTWGVYGSVGLTYMGKGFAFEGDETDDSQRHEGTWSLSTLLFFFKSGGEFNKAVLGDFEKKTLSGVEVLLRFKTNKKEDSKFNFLIGASNGFTRGAPNFAKWEFKIGIGN